MAELEHLHRSAPPGVLNSDAATSHDMTRFTPSTTIDKTPMADPRYEMSQRNCQL